MDDDEADRLADDRDPANRDEEPEADARDARSLFALRQIGGVFEEPCHIEEIGIRRADLSHSSTVSSIVRSPGALTDRSAARRGPLAGRRLLRHSRAMSEPAIAVSNLIKRFEKTVAVDDVSFTVAAGATAALLGGNGAGKTTTLSMLLGLLLPTSGSVRILGDRHGAASLPRARRG